MIKFEHVGLRYGIGPEILSDIDFTLEPGSFHFLSGPSGAGKTTLMRLMYLGLRPTRGLVTMFDHNINDLTREQLAKLRQKIGVVFQEFRLLPHLSAFDNVALPLRITGCPEKEVRSNVDELLEWVGLGDHKRALPLTLSGGQQQRIAIARAVIARPKLLLADEPTGNLDDDIGFRLMSLFEQLNRMGTTIVIATHSQTLMHKFGHPRLILDQGRLTVQDEKNWIQRKIEGVF
ncbi:MAG: cell division ATP-binding protein FtsE [Alphaproteobacteria bacterium]|nr:cell division ATP-binding protein FtsE [Alphaproteobacteria bacterium]